MIRKAAWGLCVLVSLIACGSDSTESAGQGKYGLVVMTSTPASYMVRAEANETSCEVTTSEGCRVETCTSNTNATPPKPPKPGRVVVEGARVPITIEPGTKSYYAAGAGDLFDGSTSLHVKAEASAEADAFDVTFPAPPLVTPRIAEVVNNELTIDRTKELRIEWSERGVVRIAVEVREQAFEYGRNVICEAKLDAGEVKVPAATLEPFRETSANGGRGDVTAEVQVRTISEGEVGGAVVARATRAAPAVAKTFVIK